MYTLSDIYNNPALAELTETFLRLYGIDGYQSALEEYASRNRDCLPEEYALPDFSGFQSPQPFYICRTRLAVYRIDWEDIYYLEILGHTITIHTRVQNFQKYGSLSSESRFLPKNQFIRCSQSCIVSIPKIVSVTRNKVFLSNGAALHVSRSYVANVLNAFLGYSGEI